MINGARGAAHISHCARYRWTLERTWDTRPALLVVLFNPSKADDSVDDQTITLLCHIAAHNGFGGIVVVNGIPLRSSKPGPAVEMTRWDVVGEWSDRDRLQDNLAVIQREAERAGAVLLAWGALANQCPAWFDRVQEAIREVLPAASELYCLGKTAGGYPKHPMARGKHKVPKDAPLLPWRSH